MPIQFNSILLFTLYKILTLYIVRYEYSNKVEEEGKKRILAFELTTTIL